MASNQMFATTGKKKPRRGIADLEARLAMMAEARRLEQAEEFHEDNLAMQEKSLEEQKRQGQATIKAGKRAQEFTEGQAKIGMGMDVAKFGLGQGLGTGLGSKKLFGSGGISEQAASLVGFDTGTGSQGIKAPRVGSEMGALVSTGSTQIGGTPSADPKFGSGGTMFNTDKVTLGNTIGAGALGYGIGTMLGGKKKKWLGALGGALGGGLMGFLGGGMSGGLTGGLFGGIGGALSGILG